MLSRKQDSSVRVGTAHDQLKELTPRRRAFYEFTSTSALADVIALGQHLIAAEVVLFVRVVDPWLYYGETTKVVVGVRSIVQCAR